MDIVWRIMIVLVAVTGLADRVSLGEESKVDYLTQIKPLLQSRCYACHGSLKQEANLRLDTVQLIKKGGDSGDIIAEGDKAASSVLIERVSTTDVANRMPPEHEGEKLAPAQVELLRKWIAAGAPAPEDEQPELDPREHWSFRPIVRPLIPTGLPGEWANNSIDAFIAQKHVQNHLTPQVEPPRVVLLRRLTLDLIGLPPTAEEIAAFEADASPDWYEKAVERLLADPRHGERWARHWMDVWRFSDWSGLGDQLRTSQRHMWHWRDWIVESLNNDTPYDEMLRQMLAADEIYPSDINKLRATGFLARNFSIFNRNAWMDQTVEHVGKGLLGLTLNCAKCHDHKFDPVSQADFYKFRAFFEPYLVRLDMVPGELDLIRNGIPRVYDALLETPTYLFIRGEDSRPDTSAVIAPGIPELFEFEQLSIQAVNLPAEASQPARREGILETHLSVARKAVQTAEANLQNALKQLKAADTDRLLAAKTKVPATAEVAVKQEGNQAISGNLIETFATLDKSRWEINGGQWEHQSGHVEQKQDGPHRSALRLKLQPSQDFEATLRFRILGGSRWRSVGIGFDTVRTENSVESANPASQQFVYVSGASEDSKVQISTTLNGKSTYPSAGRKGMAVEIGRDYTLRVRVRGTLINVSLNGEDLLAWRTPVSRRDGFIELVTYDALALLEEFSLRPLAKEINLTEAANGEVTAGNDIESKWKTAQYQLSLAEVDLAIAQAELKSVLARSEAMQIAWNSSDNALVLNRKQDAVRAERHVAAAKAKRVVLVAEQDVAKAPADKKQALEKKLETTRESLTKAISATEADVQPSDEFTPLSGAKWTATRFQFTGKDDPEIPLPSLSTGRRTALANWITDPRNPLTARVAVNHLWTRHFGDSLVGATFDLGRNVPAPVHSDLIDWLASELIEQKWSMKHLHRLIVNSKTYRMGSSVADREEELKSDPDNHFLWRRVPIRIESQLVRDSILALADTLDPTIGGPSVPSKDQAQSKRRSLYFFHSGNERNAFLTTFDDAAVGECYRRDQSIVPQQALALSNSGLVLDSAGPIAKRISSISSDEGSFIRNAFKVVLGIEPKAAEIVACQQALASWRNESDVTDDSARSNLVWVLLNHNDFVTLR